MWPETPLRASSCALIANRYSNPQFFYQEWYRLELERQVSYLPTAFILLRSTVVLHEPQRVVLRCFFYDEIESADSTWR